MALDVQKEHRPPLTQQAHDLICTHFEKYRLRPDNAVDATCGNGNDTVFLAKLAHQVFAFDIQKSALTNTQIRLVETDLASKVKLVHAGHEHMAEYIPNKVDCIMFNLGYLPKADKSVTTLTTTTLIALNASLQRLEKNHGLLSLLCYPGHKEGKVETQAIKQWLQELPKEWTFTEYLSNFTNLKSPILFHISPKKTSTIR